MGIGDRSAFPEHLNTKEEVEAAFPDDSQYKGFFGNLWKRWNKATKHWDAFGPRSPKGIAFSMWPPFILMRKWRETPIVLIARKGVGSWRYEADGKPDVASGMEPDEFIKANPGYYLSRIQYWSAWHWAIQWPLFFSFHKYNTGAQPIPDGTKEDRDGQLWMGYIGAKRDADRIFWWIALILGRNFK
jgi:hypothetical protein